MLRKIRTTLAVVFWLLITWLLVDFTGVAQIYLGWMAQVQFLPAVLALNVGAILFVCALTLLLGRIYCSIICPLGVMQDAIARLRRKKYKYQYSPARNTMRIVFLAVGAALLVLNVGWAAGLLMPYSTYGRIVGTFVAPLYKVINNGLASLAEHYGSYAFYSVDVWLKSIPALVIAGLALLIVGVLAWRGGRTWCNTVCPVGTILGFLSRRSLYAPVIDTDRCNSCGLCARSCKSACIDSKSHSVDMSRCVMCGDCMDACHRDAIHLDTRKGTSPCDSSSCSPVQKGGQGDDKAQGSVDQSRRAVLTSTVLMASAALLHAEEKTTDGGLAAIERKQKPQRKTLITPPGSLSIRHLRTHCTACQLCIDSCPNDVLRPSSSLDRLMQPEVSYERGYCRPECNRCSQVCPTSAIQPITVEERTAIQVGHAVWTRELCIPVRDGKTCGLCARKCPAQAIQMVPLQQGVHRDGWRWLDADNQEIPREKALLIPVVDEEKCIGCGACENLCPSNPVSAICVEGHEVHREI
ncbi:MAG: 4Fe-4S binding protein [Bacteroidaceae bacterium]